jgi:hypothetical protein
MKRIAIMAGALGFGVLPVQPALSQQRAPAPSLVTPEPGLRAPPRRPRARIIVRPRAYPYRTYHSPYPVPYPIEYPGPNAYRDCTARYVQEYRASGPVVVPQMNCWWVRR